MVSDGLNVVARRPLADKGWAPPGAVNGPDTISLFGGPAGNPAAAPIGAVGNAAGENSPFAG